MDSSPIIAIATAPGRGGVGIIRISGKDISPVMQELFGAVSPPVLPLAPRHACYLPFADREGNLIDQGIVLYFRAPHSYTGEDVLELQGHGGPVVMQMLLDRCLEAGNGIGLRLAEPGEFTRRAFLNDKLDLAQAEAVADLIDATTEAAARSASRSLSGVFSREIHELADQIVQLRALVESSLDFPEEDIEFVKKADAVGKVAAIRERLGGIFSQAAQGALLREGLHVVLAGQVNVGKSSLLNTLAGNNVAIVTPIAGTTRDKVVETIQLDGVPLTLIDTAGLRADHDANDEVERIGIERAWNEINRADIILHLLDASQGPTRNDEKTAAEFPSGIPVIQVWNKIDLSGHKPSVDHMLGVTQVYLSTHDGSGIDLLRQELLRAAGWHQTGESAWLARERHLIAMKAAEEHLAIAAEHTAQEKPPLDLLAEELRLAQDALNSIIGDFSSDDLLGVIFARFCIGK
ncbi:MAG: tRNA uridine-5-carboxymethylaminomethyl(34) synthesis GTPase MnmE [Burkholderiaceae bacterium]|jgi:tRNA modification GTPase|nr:tRNA uridine-5-carboxymethylaminomethyl(34) synthesis GTPase MnmE [Burkholderiaceae bacterium]